VKSIPASFPEVERMDEVRLNRLMTDSVALHEHVNKFEQIVAARKLLEEVQDANGREAEALIRMREGFLSRRVEVASLQSSLRDEMNAFTKRKEAVEAKHSVDRAKVIADLKKATDTLDRTSDDIVASFDRGEVDVKKFVQVRSSQSDFIIRSLLCSYITSITHEYLWFLRITWQ
jgi:hypothetical protein